MSQIDHQTRIAIADWVKGTVELASEGGSDIHASLCRDADRFAATGLIPGFHPDPSLTKRAV